MNIKKMQGNESVNSHQLNQPNCRAQPQIKFKVKRVMKTIIDLMEGGKKKSEEIKLKPHRHVDEHQRNYNSQLACART
jgi:hypothetical protein